MWTHLARKLGPIIPTRPVPVKWPGGVVSITFDDFPKSALDVGGAILEKHGVRGTYYTALSLADTNGDLGPMFGHDDVRDAHRRGHEIACHTLGHLDCGRTGTALLLRDVEANSRALSALTDGGTPTNFAFPFGAISFSAKRALARRFSSCRGTSPGINAGIADFADLRANRVSQFAGCAGSFRALIDAVRARDGWVLFYTHDVTPTPTPYGCTPAQLDAIVAYAAATAAVLPVRGVIAGLDAAGLRAA